MTNWQKFEKYDEATKSKLYIALRSKLRSEFKGYNIDTNSFRKPMCIEIYIPQKKGFNLEYGLRKQYKRFILSISDEKPIIGEFVARVEKVINDFLDWDIQDNAITQEKLDNIEAIYFDLKKLDEKQANKAIREFYKAIAENEYIGCTQYTEYLDFFVDADCMIKQSIKVCGLDGGYNEQKLELIREGLPTIEVKKINYPQTIDLETIAKQFVDMINALSILDKKI